MESKMENPKHSFRAKTLAFQLDNDFHDSVEIFFLQDPYNFTSFWVWETGGNWWGTDGGNWNQSRLNNGLEKNTLNLADATPLPGRNYPLPYVCTGDDVFLLTAYMMKSNPQKNLCLEKSIFNYRLSRMRHISENAFGFLANRWRVFTKPVLLKSEKVKAITLAVVTLHNRLRKESDIGKVYFSPTLVDREDPETGEINEGSWRKEISTESWRSLCNTRAHNLANKAKSIREELYFSLYKNRKLKIKLFVYKTKTELELAKEKKSIFCNAYFVQRSIFTICLLSQCIVY